MPRSLGSSTPAQRLVSFWAGIGCTIAPGVPEHGIAAFEGHHHVHLPPDLREFVSLCNGLSHDAGGRWDHEWLGLIEFWPLERWTALSGEYPLSPHLGLPSSYFMFADFLISSHEYGIRLTDNPRDSGPVIAYGDPAAVVAPSFSDFIVSYLEDPKHVLNPW